MLTAFAAIAVGVHFSFLVVSRVVNATHQTIYNAEKYLEKLNQKLTLPQNLRTFFTLLFSV